MFGPSEDARPFNELFALIKQEHPRASDLAAAAQKLHRFANRGLRIRCRSRE
jgi:hypothetical protein